jgi:hypothetical protein
MKLKPCLLKACGASPFEAPGTHALLILHSASNHWANGFVDEGGQRGDSNDSTETETETEETVAAA